MAKTTKTSASSPPPLSSRRSASRLRELYSGSPDVGKPPRLSLPRADLDDDSFHEVPPRLSVGLDDLEPEDGRRAVQGQRGRESFGTLRFSERFGDLVDDDGDSSLDGLAATATGLMAGLIDDDDYEAAMGDENTTRNLRALMEIDGNTVSRLSNAGDYPSSPSSDATDGEPTFQFEIPEDSRLSLSKSDASQLVEDEAEDAATDHVESDDEQQLPMPPEDGVGLIEDAVDAVEYDSSSQAAEDYGNGVEDLPASNTELERDIATPEPLLRQMVSNSDRQANASKAKERIAKPLHRSRLGNEYPPLPQAVIKKLASTYSRSFGGNGKISKDTVQALSLASDWFLEQVSDDLATYASHAKRTTIEEADVITLMKRQRLLTDHKTLFSIAQRCLPRELLQEVRMGNKPAKATKAQYKGKRKRQLESIAEDEE
jgi:histone H3/H4